MKYVWNERPFCVLYAGGLCPRSDLRRGRCNFEYFYSEDHFQGSVPLTPLHRLPPFSTSSQGVLWSLRSSSLPWDPFLNPENKLRWHSTSSYPGNLINNDFCLSPLPFSLLIFFPDIVVMQPPLRPSVIFIPASTREAAA